MFDWIQSVMRAVGLPGVALLMFLENVFPPIPSELVMPLAGFDAAAQDASLVWVIVAGSIGSLAGAVLWYEIGRRIGPKRLRRLTCRHGRWLTLSPSDFDRATAWFDRHGGMAVLIGRLVPGVRTFISVPAGFACMPFGTFLAYSTLGTVVWTALLATAGYLLRSQYHRVSDWLNPISTVVVVGLVAVYLYRVVTYEAEPEEEDAAAGA